jgi:hypothetical protein
MAADLATGSTGIPGINWEDVPSQEQNKNQVAYCNADAWGLYDGCPLPRGHKGKCHRLPKDS